MLAVKRIDKFSILEAYAAILSLFSYEWMHKWICFDLIPSFLSRMPITEAWKNAENPCGGEYSLAS